MYYCERSGSGITSSRCWNNLHWLVCVPAWLGGVARLEASVPTLVLFKDGRKGSRGLFSGTATAPPWR